MASETKPMMTDSGAGLLGAVMEWARASGAIRAELWVTEKNASALPLYRKVGFTPSAETQPLREESSLIVRKLSTEL